MSTSASMNPEQRFTKAHPCPICGGHNTSPRGQGERCFGFISKDHEWARCTRESSAGNAPLDEKSGAFVHKLSGDCKCGARHDLAASPELNGRARRRKGQKTRIAKTYDYTDELGELLYQVVRFDPKDFKQRRPNGHGDWISNLDNVRKVLYRLPEIIAAHPGETVFKFEGEKDADCGQEDGLLTTTNAGGAKRWLPEYAEQLQGRSIAIVPDHDPDGYKHAEEVARSLYGRARSIKVIRLPRLEAKGEDYHDWRERHGGTVEELRRLEAETAEWTPPEERDDGRVMVGAAIKNGIEPPAELVPDLLLDGRSHVIYSGPGLGKTFIMLWLILRVLERGLPVFLYDTENGLRIIAERLEQFGADPEQVDRLLHYYPYPSLPTTEEGRLAFEAKLERERPALVCFDSWINFLASNGLDENASNDIATFAAHYIQPARSRGIATLLLDHVPHESRHARGSTRKKDEVDVMWSLRSVQPFNRETVGQVALHREKDREGWLPLDVNFSIGGGTGRFVLSRSAGTFEAEDSNGMKPSERKALQALESFTATDARTGARAKDWQATAEGLGVKERSFWNAVKSLQEKGRVLQQENLYFPSTAKNCNGTAVQQSAVDPNATALHCTPLMGVQACSTGAADDLAGLANLYEKDAADEEKVGL